MTTLTSTVSSVNTTDDSVTNKGLNYVLGETVSRNEALRDSVLEYEYN